MGGMHSESVSAVNTLNNMVCDLSQLKDINDLSPIINLRAENGNKNLKSAGDAFGNLIGSIYGIEANSSEVINHLSLAAPATEVLDGDNRKIGLWLFKDPKSETIVGLWSDGHKKHPSRGSSYEVFLPSNQKDKSAAFLLEFTELLRKSIEPHIPKKYLVKMR